MATWRTSITAVLFLLWGAGVVSTQRPQSATPEAYRNLQVLTDKSAAGVEATMRAFNRALGVDCVHCHVPDQWHDATKTPHATARNMLRMLEHLNANQLSSTEGVTCWTCHAGQLRPSRLPGAALDVELAKWPSNLAPVDEGVKVTMSVYNVSLGVGCDYCHRPGDWKAPATPAYRVVATMTAMFEVFPKFMPKTARTQCFMCHKGSTTPRRREGVFVRPSSALRGERAHGR